ncbi:Tryptophan--tRNA ligase, mitochondrial [Aphelenchoides besseyi]|nr:Tryptophan--tRNA ligase, mitochondrial [Aphelenchoides besseyi]
MLSCRILSAIRGLSFRRYASNEITTKSRIVTGIQPSGTPHIGNYLGFIENFVRLQETAEYENFLFLADYHAISVGLPTDREQLNRNVREMTACLLACGVNPRKTTLFVQSQIPEHVELAWILSAVQSIAYLKRLPQYKDKARRYSDRDVPLGLMCYPVLQAADVLLYKGTHVPVGEDQQQHFNLMTHLADKVNKQISGDPVFPIPKILMSKNARVKSLREPTQKMSKSDVSTWSTVFVTNTADEVRAKIRKAVTDSTGTIEFAPKERPGVSNLLQILAAFTDQTDVEKVAEECRRLDTVGLKDRVAEAVNARLEPIRERYSAILSEPEVVDDVLEKGTIEAEKFAIDTMNELKKRIGFYIPRFRS